MNADFQQKKKLLNNYEFLLNHHLGMRSWSKYNPTFFWIEKSDAKSSS
jgi:hypothetical protein